MHNLLHKPAMTENVSINDTQCSAVRGCTVHRDLVAVMTAQAY